MTLTPRELEVAELVAEGLTNRQVAERLGVKVSTVENHRMAAYRKLGVHNALELARRLIADRKIDPIVPAPRPRGRPKKLAG